ncbi:hypothetical protein KUTeg_009544 [Tegillarca granosa]|uniref:Uncharacterized protein n=1 Tax=Tegillarca granosa TaxID=220873 RepID=A0ABQ9F463_TEGGR|nr:hypothetical protein KUTeg_009544 [Tegillarca granosa]
MKLYILNKLTNKPGLWLIMDYSTGVGMRECEHKIRKKKKETVNVDEINGGNEGEIIQEETEEEVAAYDDGVERPWTSGSQRPKSSVSVAVNSRPGSKYARSVIESRPGTASTTITRRNY